MNRMETFAKMPPVTRDYVLNRIAVWIAAGYFPKGCACAGMVSFARKCDYCKAFTRARRRVAAFLNRMIG